MPYLHGRAYDELTITQAAPPSSAWMVRRVDLAAPPVAKPRVFVPPSDVVTLGLPTVEQRRRASRLGGRARGRR